MSDPGSKRSGHAIVVVMAGWSVCAVLGVVSPSEVAAQQDTPEVHFRHGIELFNEDRFDAALAEFERAYELQPAFQVLYNIARVHAALGNAVESADAYQRYLAVGGDGVPAARRREVNTALATQQSRIGTLMVRTTAAAAIVSVDGRDVATTPLEHAIPLSAGSHIVEVRSLGRDLVRRAVQIAGGVEEVVEVELHAASEHRGSLRIVSRIPDVIVSVDGEEVGRTPLTAAVEVDVGRRQLRASRPGYDAYERTIEVRGGAELVLELDLVRDEDAPPDELGTMSFHLPDAPHLARVDGEQVTLSGSLTLPRGRHRIEIDMADRVPWVETIEVLGGARVLAPPLEWRPDARATLRKDAASQRGTGLAVLIGGVVGTLAAGGLTVWNELQVAATEEDARDYNAMVVACTDGSISTGCSPTSLVARANDITSARNTQDALRWVFGIGMGVGAAVAVLGLAMILGAPSDEDIDAGARIAIAPLDGGLALAATWPIR